MVIHNWNDSKAKGDAGEAALDAYFSQRYQVREVPMSEQYAGWDRRILVGDTEWKVEYKTDYRAHETGNLFVEFAIEDGTSASPGWLWKGADVVIFFIPQTGTMYRFLLKTLRWIIINNSFEVAKATNDDGKVAHGYLVPIEQISMWARICRMS